MVGSLRLQPWLAVSPWPRGWDARIGETLLHARSTKPHADGLHLRERTGAIASVKEVAGAEVDRAAVTAAGQLAPVAHAHVP